MALRKGLILVKLRCRYLAENEKNRDLIREAAGIQPLVKMFVVSWGGTPELQELACKCLLNLSISPGYLSQAWRVFKPGPCSIVMLLSL